MFQGKTDRPSAHVIRTPAYPWLLDEAGFVRAGHVLKLIDIAGSEAALHHLNQKKPGGLVVTASLDRTNFDQPIHRWEMMRLDSRITQVWNSSLETQVTVRAENIFTGESRDIATSYLVFVALDAKSRQKINCPPYRPKTLEARQLAHAADIRKQNRMEEGRTAPLLPISPEDNPVIISKTMTPNDANAQSNVFGGIILTTIHEAASQAAKRQALSGPVVGVRQDRMSFIGPTFIGETLEAKSVVTKTWNTSMELQVEVDAINPNTRQRRKVASSYLVYVRLGPNGRPGEVPPWTPQTDAQVTRAAHADLRRSLRTKEADQSAQLSRWGAAQKSRLQLWWEQIKALF